MMAGASPPEAARRPRRAVEFGPFRYEPAQRQVHSPEGPLRIGSRALGLLDVLLEEPGRLYTRDELVSRVWQRTIVEETSLRVHIAALRRQLGEGGLQGRYITNVPGRGYAFTAPVREASNDGAVRVAPAPSVQGIAASIHAPIGRDDVIGRVAALLSRSRLVSVVGPGGVGKTTVVNAAALARAGGFADGVLRVDLGGLADPGQALFEACRPGEAAPGTPESALAGRRMLIVLDHGDHADWQDAGNQREAAYTQLSPGDYQFEVRASNDDGVWNNEGATLHFRIQPAYYQTPWFAALCGVALLAGLWGLHRLRLIQASVRVQTRLEARLAERERIARELHDTLLQGFHGLMLRFQTATERIPGELPARALMDAALDRADAVLIERRHRLLGLRQEEQQPLGPALAAAGEALAVHQAAAFSLVELGSARALRPDIGDAFLRIGIEALANAFKHAQASRIEVELSHGDDQLRLRVRDDGKGMAERVLAAGQRPGHWGLTGMRERAEQIGATLTLWSRPGAGTELELRLPAARAYRPVDAPRRRGARFLRRREKEFET